MLRLLVLLSSIGIAYSLSNALVDPSSIVFEERTIIITFVSDDKEAKPKCDDWALMMERFAPDFPMFAFATVDIEFQEAFDILNTTISIHEEIHSVPESIAIIGDRQLLRTGHRSYQGVRRWLEDVQRHQEHPLYVSSNIMDLERYSQQFSASVTILSKNEPYLYGLLGDLPAVGFAWGPTGFDEYIETAKMNKFNHDNLEGVVTVFVSSVDKQITYLDSRNWINKLFKTILPPVIPYAYFTRFPKITNQAVARMTRREMYIAYNETDDLPEWMDEFSRLYSTLMVVWFDMEEDATKFGVNMSTVTVFNRSLTFTYPRVDLGLVRWFHDLEQGRIEPDKNRTDWLPPVRDDRIPELTGKTLDDAIKRHENITLLLYNDKTRDPCHNHFLRLNDSEKARMFIGPNDHERLPEKANQEHIIRFEGGRVVNASNCIDPIVYA